MKTIKIMIAASEEMHDEKLEFSNLIEHLNEVLEPRGFVLRRVKWNPETDGSIEEFKAKLKDCEMCLTLYWRNLAGNSEQELNTAYEELKEGKNPRNLYVFFKEPTEDLTEALKDFKANFVTNYGHFFCKFENVDTMNLHFILQFEAFQNQFQQESIIKVVDEKVLVDDKEFVNFSNIPFAAMNKEYQRLHKELSEIDKRVAEARMLYKADPDNENLEDELMAKKVERKKIADEFEKYQKHLFDIALTFVKQSSDRYSERMKKAREQFEKGNVIGADQILNIEEMKREAQQELILHKQSRYNLDIKIDEFRLKADTVMANTLLPISDRFEEACEAYKESINLARQLELNNPRYLELLFDYSHLLLSFNKNSESVIYLEEALTTIRQKKEDEPNEDNLLGLSRILNNLGVAHWNLLMYDQCIIEFEESLDLRKALIKIDPDYVYDVIESLGNIAGVLLEKGKKKLAEEKAEEMLKLCKGIENGDDQIAYGKNLMGSIHEELREYDRAMFEYQEAKNIREKLAKLNPQKHLSELANTINNLADLYTKLEMYDEARDNYEEALSIRKKMADENPLKYLDEYSQSLANIARLDCSLCSYSESVNGYLKAMRILERLTKQGGSYNKNLALIYYGVGFSYFKMEEYEHALLYFKKCKDEYLRILLNTDGIVDDLIDVICNIAEIYENVNEFSKAIEEYHEARILCDKYLHAGTENYMSKIVTLSKDTAVLYDSLEMWDSSLEYYKESLKYAYELYHLKPDSYKELLPVMIMLTALAHHQLSHYDIALDLYDESLKLFNALPVDIKEGYAEEIETVLECIDDINSQK